MENMEQEQREDELEDRTWMDLFNQDDKDVEDDEDQDESSIAGWSVYPVS